MATNQSGGSSPSFVSRLVDLAFRALPAIGSAIGFVGIVALVGAAIEWVRFDTIGLPATQAVHAIPQGELVADGAWALALFVLLGLLAVVVAFLFRRGGFGSPRLGFLLLGAAETLTVAGLVGDWKTALGLGIWLLIAAVAWQVAKVLGAGRLLTRATRAGSVKALEDSRSHWRSTKTQAEQARASVSRLKDGDAPGPLIADAEREWTNALRAHLKAEARWAQVITSVGNAHGLSEPLGRLDRGSERASSTSEDTHDSGARSLQLERPDLELASDNVQAVASARAQVSLAGEEHHEGSGPRMVGLIALLGILLLALLLLTVRGSDAGWLALTMMAVFVVNALVYAITRVTPRFGWYAVAVFLSVVVLGGLVGVVRTRKNAQVQPVAVIRKGEDVAVCGVYVTETDNRLYIGRLKQPVAGVPTDAPPNIFWIRDSDIDMVRLGALETRKTLTQDTLALASELYADRAEQQLPAVPETTTVTTTPGPRSGASKQVTSEAPPVNRHPMLKARPPGSSICTASGGPVVSPRYDP